MRYQTNQQFARIAELLDGGDWACSFGQCGTLSYICAKLADLIKEDQRLVEKAWSVAREAECNLDTATLHWSELADELRHSPRLRRQAEQTQMMH
jgi:hypothetical protein